MLGFTKKMTEKLQSISKRKGLLNSFSWEIFPVESKQSFNKVFLHSKDISNQTEQKAFIEKSIEKIHDPALLIGIEKAKNRIISAIKNEEKIFIFGDFDADGVMSTVLLVDALKNLGAKVSYRIPDRLSEQHGLNNRLIDDIKKADGKLIITCDCASNDWQQSNYAKSLEIDIIITDHHILDEERSTKHQCIALINPLLSGEKEYPFPRLAGVGVTFKLIQFLIMDDFFLGKFPDKKAQEKFLQKYLELVAIGTIADCMPLIDENRILISQGIENIRQTQWIGLKDLLINNNIDLEKIIAEDISFVIAPRINAASRMGNVLNATELFLSNSPEKRTICLLKLEERNQARKTIFAEILHEARQKISQENSFIWVTDENWSVGLCGLVAGKLSEQHQCPAFVGKIDKENNIVQLSARAPAGRNLIKAIEQNAEFLNGFGGHHQAAGLNLNCEKVAQVQENLSQYFSQEKVKIVQKKAFLFDLKNINLNFLQEINKFAPFGIGNEEPFFYLENGKILAIKELGKTGEHWKCTIQFSQEKIDIIIFNFPELRTEININENYNLIIAVKENNWQGRSSLQFLLQEIWQN